MVSEMWVGEEEAGKLTHKTINKTLRTKRSTHYYWNCDTIKTDKDNSIMHKINNNRSLLYV